MPMAARRPLIPLMRSLRLGRRAWCKQELRQSLEKSPRNEGLQPRGRSLLAQVGPSHRQQRVAERTLRKRGPRAPVNRVLATQLAEGALGGVWALELAQVIAAAL